MYIAYGVGDRVIDGMRVAYCRFIILYEVREYIFIMDIV